MSDERPAAQAPAFFDYDLPPQLIAQEPCAERDASRLEDNMVDAGLLEGDRELQPDRSGADDGHAVRFRHVAIPNSRRTLTLASIIT